MNTTKRGRPAIPPSIQGLKAVIADEYEKNNIKLVSVQRLNSYLSRWERSLKQTTSESVLPIDNSGVKIESEETFP